MSGAWSWETETEVTSLEGERVDGWLVDLAVRVEDEFRCLSLLSEDERERVAGLRHEQGKRDYLVARANLRRLLGSYEDTDPASLVFRYGENGKPSLAPVGRTTLEFNVSHTSGVALVAFSRNVVGVDVEKLDRKADIPGVSRRFFTPAEGRSVLRYDGEARTRAFYQTWTCKEACMKWTGRGISGGLDAHEITFGDREPVATGVGDQLKLWTLRPGSGWVGALAAREGEGPVCRVWGGRLG